MNAQAELAPNWVLLIPLALGALVGIAVVVGVVVWAVTAGPRRRPARRPGRADPLPVARRVDPYGPPAAPAQPLPAFRWPDDEKSLAGQRALAALLALLVAVGLVVILVGVIPKAGFGFNAVMLYVIALVAILPVITGLLRWGFRQPSEPPRPAGGRDGPGLSPAMKRFIAGLVPGVLFLALALVVLAYGFDARYTRGGRWELGAVLGFAVGIVLTVIVQRRLSRWAYPEWWRRREELLYPDRVRPAAKAGPPRPAAPRTRPSVGLGWLVGLPIAVAVVLGVVITTANGGHVGVQRVDALLVGALVAFGAFMLVRQFRHAAPAEAPAAVPLVAAPAVEVPAAAPVPPPLPRSCPKCGRAIAAGAPEGLCPRCLIGDLLPEEPRHSPTTAYGPFVPPEVSEVAAFFPHLEVIRLIGQGGMGAVYLARQKQLDRLVALKLINVREDDPTFAERFAREAKAMGKLSHPNVVTIHDHGTADGLPYLVMEYVDGVTLRDAMRAKSLTPAEALKIIPQVCDALEYAHAQGVVHRDVKPENILLDRSGRVKIADFGLAKLVDPDGLSLTHTRQAMGTPHYMAPEQWERPTEVDHRADIYALGVLLYELLTGELPLGRFDPPSVKARVDARIDELVLRALAKEPGRRYQQASDVKLALERLRTPGGWTCAGAFREYRSKTTLLGWPLVHVTAGIDPRTGRPAVAKGWVAVGDSGAVGAVAVAGGFAAGGLALAGGGALGVITLAGGAAAGAFLAAAGGFAAAGGMAVAGGFAAAQFVAIAGGFARARASFSGGGHQDPHFWQRFEEYWDGVWTDYLWPF